MPDSSPIQHGSFAESLARLQSEHHHSNTQTQPPQEQLPPVPSKSAEWEQFRNSPALNAYRQDLLNLTTQARQFLLGKAQPGKGRQLALDGLQTFENSKVNAASRHLKAITFGLNRTNLRHLCALLNNEQIPIEERSSVAIELFGSLGVCGEGEALNIQSAIENLQSRTQGLAAKILHARNQLIDQHLLALVRHESKGFSNAKVMEIHHVQGLKNAVADAWGLVVHEDESIANYFQEGVSPVAKALLEKTVTPHSIATVVADNLYATLSQNTKAPPGQWIPYDQKSIDTLSNVLQVECGKTLGLHDVIETAEDFSQFRLKSPVKLQSAILAVMAEIKLMSPNEIKRPQPSVKPLQQTIESLSHLKNMRAFNQRHASADQFSRNTHPAYTPLQLGSTQFTDDKKRKRQILGTPKLH